MTWSYDDSWKVKYKTAYVQWWLLLHYLDKYLRKTTERKEWFILAHGFRGLSFHVWPHVRGQNVMVLGVCSGGGCLPHGEQEAENETGPKAM
jgi:hypothetical protein